VLKRAIKKLADEAPATLSPVFDAVYAEGGRPSIPPERLLKSMLLMALYTVRSERQFCEPVNAMPPVGWAFTQQSRTHC
jgi:transposase